MSWLKRKWQWAAQNPLFWANAGLAIAVVLLVCIFPAPNCSDFRIKTLGMALQLIGVLTVWLDLSGTARQFDKAGIWRRTWSWLKAGWGRQTITLAAGSASATARGGTARLKVRRPILPLAPIFERLANLEELASQLDHDIDRSFIEINQLTDTVTEKIRAERAERTQSLEQVNRSLVRATTGNYAKLAFGAVWLAIGIALSTLAPEIAKAVAGQWEAVWSTL